MQSFALFSAYLFHSLHYNFHPFSFISDQPHLLRLLWHYYPFIICFFHAFHSPHFSTFPSLLHISFFPLSSSQNSKNNFGQAGNRKSDSCYPGAKPELAAEWIEKVWGILCNQSNCKKVEAEGRGPRPILFIYPGQIAGCLGKLQFYDPVSECEQNTGSQSLPTCARGNDWDIILVGTVISERT